MWHRYVLPVTDPRYCTGGSGGGSGRPQGASEAPAEAEDVVDCSSAGGGRGEAARMPAAASPETAAAAAAVASAAAADGEPVNRQLLAWGLSPAVARDAVNIGFAGSDACPLALVLRRLPPPPSARMLAGLLARLGFQVGLLAGLHACWLVGLPPPENHLHVHACRPL